MIKARLLNARSRTIFLHLIRCKVNVSEKRHFALRNRNRELPNMQRNLANGLSNLNPQASDSTT